MTTTPLTSTALLLKTCRHTETALAATEAVALLQAVPDWQLDGESIVRTFAFRNYYETLAFINAIAWVIHAEDHHPELVVTYNRCVVRFNTHSVNQGRGGLSENDFICAAKVDAVFQQSPARA